jgi:hypothetical protein
MCVRVIDFCIYRKHSSCVTKLSEIDIIAIRELLIDYIFVMFSVCVFQQTVGIHMGINCAPLLAEFVPVFVLSRFYARDSQQKQKGASPFLWYEIPLCR